MISIIDNEEAVQAHKQEIHRQGYLNHTNTEQTGNERCINVKYKGRPDLQVPIDISRGPIRGWAYPGYPGVYPGVYPGGLSGVSGILSGVSGVPKTAQNYFTSHSLSSMAPVLPINMLAKAFRLVPE
jgi:hypothetical protein